MSSHLFPQIINNYFTTGSALTATATGSLIDFRSGNGFLTIKIKASAYAGAGDFTLKLYGDFSITSAGALTTSNLIKELQNLSGGDVDVHVIPLTMADGLLPYMRADLVLNSGTSITLASCDLSFQLWS